MEWRKRYHKSVNIYKSMELWLFLFSVEIGAALVSILEEN
ncbi:hypothetical protein AA23498_3095 [Acetobacter nitrogenifigens DSM 23921 = NBRC 105050]|nr:hypothetical protein AA23498_3095 [Acetobacter nitrogenifigens DSM 23921 = NBRC 105050]